KVQPAQLEVDSRSFPARGLADAWQRGAAQAERGRGSSLSLPEESHPLALDGDTDGDDLLNHVDFIARQIGLLDKEMAKRMRRFEAAIEMLDAIYGIGRRTAEDILAEIGVDMSRWPSHRHIASWAKISPRNHTPPAHHPTASPRPHHHQLPP